MTDRPSAPHAAEMNTGVASEGRTVPRRLRCFCHEAGHQLGWKKQKNKQAAISYQYVFCNLKNIDVVDFEQRLRWSKLFIDPVDRPMIIDPLESDQPFCGTLMSEFQLKSNEWSDQCRPSRLHLFTWHV